MTPYANNYVRTSAGSTQWQISMAKAEMTSLFKFCRLPKTCLPLSRSSSQSQCVCWRKR